MRGRLREADRRRRQGARGQHAVVGIVRSSAARNIAIGVLPPRVKARVSVEQASTFGWERYARRNIGMTYIWRFGAAQRTAEEVRVHSRSCSGRGQGRNHESRRAIRHARQSVSGIPVRKVLVARFGS